LTRDEANRPGVDDLRLVEPRVTIHDRRT